MRRLEEVVFWKDYVGACRSSGHEPPKGLRVQVGRPTLEISKAEALTVDEWKPLLSTLSKDTSLHYIAVGATSSRYKVLEGMVLERDVRGSGRRIPALYTKYLMGSLANSLSHTISSSKCLTSLFLSKIPIKDQYLNTLCLGIGKTRSLQHLALHHCPVEDEGCSSLCKALASRPTLTTLDLTDCALSQVSAEHIATLIKRQCCVRVSEVWKGSLRYGCPEGDDMPGLRRLTLNLNPAMGDKGVEAISSALQDDIWIKGVDMQGCGISEEGAETVGSLLEVNRCLTVFDLRGNPDAIPALPGLMARLRANLAFSRPGQYKCRWLEEVPPPSARVSQMTLNSSAPPSRGSLHGSDTSIKSVASNSSEPPWTSNVPKRKPTLVKKQLGRGKILKTHSLEEGVHKLRFVSIKTPPSSRQDELDNEDAMSNGTANVVIEEEDEIKADNIGHIETLSIQEKKPLVGVSKEQFEILNNFKSMTQSFVKARVVSGCGDGADITPVSNNKTVSSKMGLGNLVEFGGGDCQPSVPSSKLKPQAKEPKKKLEAGDANVAEGEDYFKERAHRLLRKLIKLRHDRGLERNEGVMRVCSQLSLQEPNIHPNKDVAQASASFLDLASLRKSSQS